MIITKEQLDVFDDWFETITRDEYFASLNTMYDQMLLAYEKGVFECAKATLIGDKNDTKRTLD